MSTEEKPAWVKVVNFIVDVLKLVVAIFGGVTVSNLMQ